MHMERRLITIPCGGRPKKTYSSVFLETLRFQRATMTVKAMAEYYEVSESTMFRWLRKAGCVNSDKKTAKSAI